MKLIPFNKPFLTGKETYYIEQAVNSGKISGNGMFTKKCQSFFEKEFSIKKALLTNSCTDALEMSAILAGIEKGDEVIMPSYTFVSTANAFILRGATIIFCDSKKSHPCIDEDKIEALITKRTKVIVPVHYAGMACNMGKIMHLSKKYNLIVIEDAAQAIDNCYIDDSGNKQFLGSIGHMATFSFHETKNIISGEGGLLAINDERYIERSEIIWEKGTNRSAFFRGEIDKYGWVDIGSSYLPSEVTAAFLWAQLENLELIQQKRVSLWNYYDKEIEQNRNFIKCEVPDNSSNNAHLYFITTKSLNERDRLLAAFKKNNIYAVFHYQSLHKSEFFKSNYQGEKLSSAENFSNCLIRLPLYYELNEKQQNKIINFLNNYH